MIFNTSCPVPSGHLTKGIAKWVTSHSSASKNTMTEFSKYFLLFASLCITLSASELKIQLAGNENISHNKVKIQCDKQATALGLPSGAFDVEYLNGGGNSLAVLPIGGKSLIFANVISGSGARYASRDLIWWDAGTRGISLSSETNPKLRTSCKTAE